jgi:hypothetical protein
MNSLVFNRNAGSLKTAIYGQYAQDFVPVATDEEGNFVFSPASLVTVTASNLDIRNLTSARDTVNVTAVNFDIRDLNGTQDSIAISAKGFVETQTSLSVATNSTVYLLTQEIGAYSQNSYFLRNTNAIGSITVTLQIAPVDDTDYYVSSTTTGVSAGSNYLTAVATLMRYARLRVETGGAAVGVTAYYNARA